MSNELTFAVGDVVRLICGGPKMVVERWDDRGNVVCTWFTHANDCESRPFPEVALTLVESH